MVSKKTVFAVDIGGSKLLCGFVRENGDILDTEKTLLCKEMTTELLEKYIVEAYTKLKERNPDVLLSACGVTIPGVADAKKGRWIYACFSGISDYPISERLSKLLSLPVFSAACEDREASCATATDVPSYLIPSPLYPLGEL